MKRRGELSPAASRRKEDLKQTTAKTSEPQAADDLDLSNPDDYTNLTEDLQEEQQLYPALRQVAGIKNATGQDCFSISVLHLLAQTELLERLEVKSDHQSCTKPSCIIGKSFLA